MKTNTLLVGSTGTGKTYCLRTFLDMGVTPFIISTEELTTQTCIACLSVSKDFRIPEKHSGTAIS